MKKEFKHEWRIAQSNLIKSKTGLVTLFSLIENSVKELDGFILQIKRDIIVKSNTRPRDINLAGIKWRKIQ